MYRNLILKSFFLVSCVTFLCSCDKDFDEVGANIIGDDHFGFDKYEAASIKSYNQPLGPIGSNNQEVNPLGIYTNPAFGTTTASFVTQLEMSSVNINPTFTTINNPPVIDSVILYIPYFSRLKDDTNNINTYSLDSIFGVKESKFKLSIHESGYYLRDLEPSSQFEEQQLFYTDKNAEIDSYKIGSRLNDNANTIENDQFYFRPEEIVEKTLDENDEVVRTKFTPAMRLHLRKDFFTSKILNAPSGQLYSNNIFKNYMRGLYFKVENPNNNPGNMAMINFKGGKVTVYYKQDVELTPDDPETPVNEQVVDRLKKTFIMNLTGNTVSLLENSNENASYLAATNSTLEAEKIFLKGGQGAMAIIDLFGTTDLITYDKENDIIINEPNGIPDEIDNIKKNKWLINEANLTFYIDQSSMSNLQTFEPPRIYLYDIDTKNALADYYFDSAINSSNPKLNKPVYGGILSNEDATVVKQIKNDNGEIANKGFKYKIRITNHLRNLIKNDSTNVRLGLTVTESIATIGFSKLKTPNVNNDRAPRMSVISPVGTILYGTNIPVGDPNYDKRLRLEIYYTKPD
jgi:hypothetical protein